jgi:hypothetical protein
MDVCCWATFCRDWRQIVILEPYFPSEAEQQNPALYAANVRSLMAEKLGAKLSRHSIDDNLVLKRHKIRVDWRGRHITQNGKPIPVGAPKAHPDSPILTQ